MLEQCRETLDWTDSIHTAYNAFRANATSGVILALDETFVSNLLFVTAINESWVRCIMRPSSAIAC